MKLVIVGTGKVGEKMVEFFSKANHNVVVVDIDYKTVETVVNKYDVKGVVGFGLDRSVLADAEVSSADFFIACTPRDELNVLSCVMAKKLGAAHTVARVRSPEYFEEVETISNFLGVDMVFNPEYRTALEIANILKYPFAHNVENFAGGKALLLELHVEPSSALAGKTVEHIIGEAGTGVLFAMAKRAGKVFIPRGDFVVQEGDVLHVIASKDQIVGFCKKLGLYKRQSKNVFVIGGSMTAYYLAKELETSDTQVKILDIDEKRCQELSQKLPKAVILSGDGTDTNVLDEERLKDADACITLTGIDEENVIISLYAQQKKVSKIITKISRPAIMSLVKNLGLDTVLSPHTVIANHILQFVRSSQSSNGLSINALYKISDVGEALEFTVDENFPKRGIPLENLKLKSNFLIGGIVRDDEFILPNGKSILLAGDRIIVVTTKNDITDLEQILR